jgi:hypothetical protein
MYVLEYNAEIVPRINLSNCIVCSFVLVYILMYEKINKTPFVYCLL